MTSPIPFPDLTPAQRKAFGCHFGRSYRATDAVGTRLGISAPPAGSGSAFDVFTNAAARMGWGTPNLAEGADYEMVRLSFDYWLLITLYRNHWITRRIVDTPASDMVRAWPTINTDAAPEDLDRVDKAIRKTGTRTQIRTTIMWARLFGGAGALIMVDGHENKLEEPLKLDEVEINSYCGLIPFDRWTGITPEGSVAHDITRPSDFNLPEFYRVTTPMGGGSFRIHASRILRFTGPTVPTPEREAQSWWGISAIEPAYEELRKRDNLSWNLLSLSFRASLIGMVFPDMAQMLSGAGMGGKALEQFQLRMQSINHLMSNQSLIMLPKDGSLQSVQWAATGYSDLYAQFQMDIAGAAEIPVTRLFGRTITGLGQTNDADERIYEERIAMEQEHGLRPQLEKLYPVVCMCLDPTTPIHLQNGEVREIRQVKVGDKVLTSSGRSAFVRGVSPSTRVDTFACELSLYGNYSPLVSTCDHPVLTPDGFIPCEVLDVGDYVSMPVRKLSATVTHATISRRRNRESLREDKQKLTRDFGWLCGLYLAEGTPHSNTRLPDHRLDSITFSIHDNEVEPFRQHLEKATGERKVTSRKLKQGKGSQLTLYDTGLAQWLAFEFGHGAERKCIPDWVFDTDPEFARGLIGGYLEGDGHAPPHRSQISASSVSLALMVQLRDLLASAGYGWACLYRSESKVSHLLDGRREIHGREFWRLFLNGEGVYRLRSDLDWMPLAEYHPRRAPRWKYSEYRDFIWIEVSSIRRIPANGFYDLEVDAPEHDFCTLQCCVHNSTLGEVPDDLELNFPSVRVLTEEEKSNLSKDTVVNITSLVNAGLMNKPQAMKELKQQSDITGFGSNYTDADIQAAEEAEQMGLGGTGEMAGLPGGEEPGSGPVAVPGRSGEPPAEGEPTDEELLATLGGRAADSHPAPGDRSARLHRALDYALDNWEEGSTSAESLRIRGNSLQVAAGQRRNVLRLRRQPKPIRSKVAKHRWSKPGMSF
jgi:phage-related protein (TIGR01555 family)